MTNKAPRTRLIGKVHQAKKVLGMDDATYRAVLERRTGKPSCKDMTVTELAGVMNEMVRLGFKGKGTGQGAAATFYLEIKDSDPNARQKRKILAMWAALGYGEAYLHERCQRQFGVDRFEFLRNQADLQVLTKDLVNRCNKSGMNPYPER